MALDAASQFISGLLNGDASLIDELSKSIGEEHFTDPTLKALYRAILLFRSVSGGVLSAESIDAMTRELDAGSAALFQETYAALREAAVGADVARFARHTLRADREKHLTQTALREASDIITSSVTEEGYNGRPGRTWSGPADAREWAAARIAEINNETQVVESPAADVMQEGKGILSDYSKARHADVSRYPLTGIPMLDEKTGGFGKGLIMVAASSGFGKSQFCVSTAYHTSQMQGLNVFFATSETVRSMVRARLVARHSRHEKFEEFRGHFNLPDGLDSKLIDRGKLPDAHIPYLVEVAKDWGADGSLNSEGCCYVAQMPFGMTMSSLKSQIETYSRTIRKPDLVVIDYIALMSSGHRMLSSREDLSTVVKEAAHFAVDFDKGEGVPVISPWQLNRESQKEWTRTGELDQNGLAETAEAVNSSHLVLALSQDAGAERDGRKTRIKINILKSRDGETLTGDRSVPVAVDYATSFFEAAVGAPGADGGDPFAAPVGDFTDAQASMLVPGLSL